MKLSTQIFITLEMTWLSITPGKMLLTALATVVIMLSTTFIIN